jgi:ribosomal protein S18 acetylase RimI-like enzyme
MMLVSRPYQSEADLFSIQAATAEWIALAGFRGYINVSDIALRLFNGMGQYDPAEIVRLWEDADGRVVAWAMAYPAWRGYEALHHPDHYAHAPELLDWAESETLCQMQKAGLDHTCLIVDVFEDDAPRIALLEQRGYRRGDSPKVIATRSLEQSIPPPQLPDSFSVRSAQGEAEAEKIVSLINDSFGWHWTVERYQRVMRAPGYRADNEWVVVAPDGRFAASCLLLPDAHNRTGMFENVGTHSAFRRLGLGKALLYAGMRHMQAQGFILAMVPHTGEVAASALYTSVGFQPTYRIAHYSRCA